MASFYNTQEVVSMIMDDDGVSSEGESDISEDPDFPLPCNTSDSESESEPELFSSSGPAGR